jgi:predicted class III extradiol MEMO1 family dioxygenase
MYLRKSQCLQIFKINMSQSNMFVYSSEMVHYSDDMFHRSEQEELIMSDEEDDYLMQNLHLISASQLIQEI